MKGTQCYDLLITTASFQAMSDTNIYIFFYILHVKTKIIFIFTRRGTSESKSYSSFVKITKDNS